MSDFIMDFRSRDNRLNMPEAKSLLRYFDFMRAYGQECDQHCWLVSRADDWDNWGPYQSLDRSVQIILVGRTAMDAAEWDSASHVEGEGGLASKAIYKRYIDGGIAALSALNGQFVVLVDDVRKRQLFIVTDRCGMAPCFMHISLHGMLFGSHPDILAKIGGIESDLDETSLTEFLVTGKVSFPHSYYKKIQALDFGSIHTIDYGMDPRRIQSCKHFQFNFKIDNNLTENDIAEELAEAFRKSMAKRTLSRLGKTAISLSGGLDSRALLCAAPHRESISAFCFFDSKNDEFSIAEKIAAVVGVPLFPFRREFDHYGRNARRGTWISSGMGDFGNNHYMGFIEQFRELGFQNIIAGFYCDYFFKGLLFNKKKDKLFRTERLASFDYQTYMPFFWFNTSLARNVKMRLEQLFPSDLRNDTSDENYLRLEERRLFPLCYEPDNQETLIPQRTLGWYLPILDNEVIDVYLKIPPRFKINVSMYNKMVQIVCGKKVSAITNINTNAPLPASQLEIAIRRNWQSIRRRLSKKNSIATDESWQNWRYYLLNSSVIKELWRPQTSFAKEMLSTITGADPFLKTVDDYIHEKKLKLFLRLMTLKLWLDNHPPGTPQK